MPAQVTKSVLSGAIGSAVAKAVNKHKGDEVKYDTGGGLPDGIENGVARLTECKFGVYDKGDMKGKPYFMAAGIVVEPKVHNGVKVEGRRTSIIEPVCDTPTRGRKTVEEHVAWILNEMKKLGAGDAIEQFGGEGTELEEIAAALKEAGPTFGFRTWKGQKQTTGPYAGKEPRVNETWGGLVEEPIPDAADTGVVDQSANDDGGAGSGEPGSDDPPADEPDAEAENADEPDLDDLAAKGDAKKPDKASQDKLKEIALAKGISDDDVENAESWSAVVEMIRNAEDSPAEDEPASDVAAEPQKGDVFWYTLLDPKTKKPLIDPKTKKPKRVEVEIKSVDKKTKTAVIVNLDTKAEVAKGVPYDQLVAS